MAGNGDPSEDQPTINGSNAEAAKGAWETFGTTLAQAQQKLMAVDTGSTGPFPDQVNKAVKSMVDGLGTMALAVRAAWGTAEQQVQVEIPFRAEYETKTKAVKEAKAMESLITSQVNAGRVSPTMGESAKASVEAARADRIKTLDDGLSKTTANVKNLPEHATRLQSGADKVTGAVLSGSGTSDTGGQQYGGSVNPGGAPVSNKSGGPNKTTGGAPSKPSDSKPTSTKPTDNKSQTDEQGNKGQSPQSQTPQQGQQPQQGGQPQQGQGQQPQAGAPTAAQPQGAKPSSAVPVTAPTPFRSDPSKGGPTVRPTPSGPGSINPTQGNKGQPSVLGSGSNASGAGSGSPVANKSGGLGSGAGAGSGTGGTGAGSRPMGGMMGGAGAGHGAGQGGQARPKGEVKSDDKRLRAEDVAEQALGGVVKDGDDGKPVTPPPPGNNGGAPVPPPRPGS